MITSESGRWTQREIQVPLSQTWRQIRSALAACESANHKAAVATPIRNLVIVSLRSAPRGQPRLRPAVSIAERRLVPYLVMKARAYAAGPSFGCYRPFELITTQNQ